LFLKAGNTPDGGEDVSLAFDQPEDERLQK
jgi:hypothetical protein